MSVTPTDVRNALLAGCDGFTELRSWPSGDRAEGVQQVWHHVEDVAAWQRDCKRLRASRQLFWGVATRRAPGGDTKADCLMLPAVWTDLDFDKVPETDVRRGLYTFALPPSIVIASGNGLHAYWLLDTPHVLVTDADREQAEAVNKALRLTLQGDAAACDVARVLRVPGSWHMKTATRRLVTIEVCEADRRYALTALRDYLDELGAWHASTGSAPQPHRERPVTDVAARVAAYVAACDPAIQGQHGDLHTFQVCSRVARGFDLTEDAALDALRDWNARCVPPWSERDLLGKIRNALRNGKEPIGGRLNASAPNDRRAPFGTRPTASAGAPHAAPAPNTTPRPALRVRCLADVQPVPLRPLWDGHLYRGKLSLFAGMGEIGKTYAVCDIAARGSTGRPMPDGQQVGRFRTLIVSAEDSAEDTLVPRLERLNGNRAEVFVIDGEDAAGFLLGRDLSALEQVVQAHRIDLVVFDALNSFIGGKLDTTQDASIRSVLGPLVALAARLDVAIAGIAHFGKGDQAHVVNKILGSVGFVNLARVVVGFAPDVETPGRAFMAVVKNNLAPKPEALAYRIDPVTGGVHWESAAGLDVVQTFNAKPGRQSGTTQSAADWLRDTLTPLGSVGMASTELIERGAAAGYRRDVLFAAKGALGVRARKLGFARGWAWYLDAHEEASRARGGRTSDASTLRENIKDFTKSREESDPDASHGWQRSSFEASEPSAPPTLRDASGDIEEAADVA